MTGIEQFKIPAFNQAELLLNRAGFHAINPANILPYAPEHRWEDYLREDLRALLDVQGVAALDGWEKSRGATLEIHVARALNIPVHPLRDWLSGQTLGVLD